MLPFVEPGVTNLLPATSFSKGQSLVYPGLGRDEMFERDAQGVSRPLGYSRPECDTGHPSGGNGERPDVC